MHLRRDAKTSTPLNPRNVIRQDYLIAAGHNRVYRLRDSTAGAVRYPDMNLMYDANGARIVDSASSGTGQGIDTRSRVQLYDASGRMSGLGYALTNVDFTWQVNTCQYYPDGQLSHPCGSAPNLSYDGHNVTGTTRNRSYTIIQGPGVDDPLMAVGHYAGGGGFPVWKTYYYVTDGRGGLLASSDSNGTLVAGTDDNGLQQGWQWSGGTSNSTTFASSRMSIPETPEVSMFRNRAYDSRTGRWLQEDPLGVSGGINLYQFNGNNPATFSDPFGLLPDDNDCCEKLKETAKAVKKAVGKAVERYLTAQDIKKSGEAAVKKLKQGQGEQQKLWDSGGAEGVDEDRLGAEKQQGQKDFASGAVKLVMTGIKAYWEAAKEVLSGGTAAAPTPLIPVGPIPFTTDKAPIPIRP